MIDAANRIVKTYSGGMRRRLDLAVSLIVSPPILFLDEPTTGLDPRSRLGMWELIGQLVEEGTTVLLTTQYLEEADQLANQIAVIDHGQVIASGTSDELKVQVGGERLDITVAQGSSLDAAIRVLRPYSQGEPQIDSKRRTMVISVSNGSRLLVNVVRDLDEAGVQLDNLSLRRPTLDDVFLTLTGHAAETPATEEQSLADLARNTFVVLVMIIVGLLVGFRPDGSVLGWIEGFGLLLLFGFALSWLGALMGLSVRSVEAAQSAGFIWLFPLTFASSAFVQTSSMPDWLRAFADHQPVTLVINTVREFILGKPVGAEGWQALAWCLGILIVFVTLAVWASGRRTTR